ncbi:hypothetical protein [Paractinoplanes ferrugineus]|uniref:hypothetical protein n=1 Tax=Paractinoplanes ferrugineus TaxID=113564 RepID=UPI0031DB1B6B
MQPSPAEEFWKRLRALYAAAGRPDLATICRQAAHQPEPLKLKDATLSEWFRGTAIPSLANERALLFVVAFLDGRARSRDSGRSAERPGELVRLCGEARRTRRPRPAAGVLPRSVYLEQLRQQVAPPELFGRAAELAELAAFCSGDGAAAYAWWQAGPWAGKTALLSTFVAAPPTEFGGRLWMVAFFITARLAGQDTREAFTEVVTKQLCQLLGQQEPDGLTESTRDAALLDLFAQAARNRADVGGRLVLVVDGLDEDRGVTTGETARSIAGLLPSRPPSGMRVLVAGRPNPPVPDDVPDWHPLRDPGIVRLLPASPHARDLQRLGKAELKRLMSGTTLERDVLGLVTAARGGLTGRDLCALTDAGLLEVEEVLHTAPGRTFDRRSSILTAGHDVYLLGHEELQTAARAYLGDAAIARHEDRLHRWADGFRNGAPAWPAHTPDYLLTGYPRLLATHHDARRLVLLATDEARHDRLLAVTGGDAAALAEIGTAQTELLDRCAPSVLGDLALLSHRRAQLARRNSKIPVDLPAVWETLGNGVRADALTDGIIDASRRMKALALLAVTAAGQGRVDRAEEVAWSILFPITRDMTLADTAEAAAGAGAWDGAEKIVQSIPDGTRRGVAFLTLARLAAEAGDHDRAERIALDHLTDPRRTQALAAVAGSAAAAGDHGPADRLVAEAEQVARSRHHPIICADAWIEAATIAVIAGRPGRVPVHLGQAQQELLFLADPEARAFRLTELASIAATTGNDMRTYAYDAEQAAASMARPDSVNWIQGRLIDAACLATDVEYAMRVAATVGDRSDRERGLAMIAKAIAGTGDLDTAETLARTITSPARLGEALTWLTEVAAGGGDLERAERTALSITFTDARIRALIVVATAAARDGRTGHADRIAAAVAVPAARAEVLAALARTAGEGGDHDRARTLAVAAEQAARSTVPAAQQAAERVSLIGAVCATGDVDRAERLAAAITEPELRARALAVVTEAACATGDLDRAEQIALGIGYPGHQGRALAAIARGAAAIGLPGWAEQTARDISQPGRRAEALIGLVGEFAGQGDAERARILATEAERDARSVTDPARRAEAQSRLAEAVAAAGDLDHARALAAEAEQVAGTIPFPARRAEALTALVRAVAGAVGDHGWAERITAAITSEGWRAQATVALIAPLVEAGEADRAERLATSMAGAGQSLQAIDRLIGAAVAAGDIERAERVARSAGDPGARVVTLNALLRAFLAAGRRLHARRLATEVRRLVPSIELPGLRARTLTSLIPLAGDIGGAALTHELIADATRAVAAIERPEDRARAQIALAAVADPASACRLLAEAFVDGAWGDPLPVAADRFPEALARFAEAVSGFAPAETLRG